MATNWHTFCINALQIEDDRIAVLLETKRRQLVQVREDDGSYTLASVVARPRVVDELTSPSLMAWQRNRTAALVGFRVDDRGRMIAEAVVPKVGLTPDEFRFYVITLAAEADRFEHQLTGHDAE